MAARSFADHADYEFFALEQNKRFRLSAVLSSFGKKRFRADSEIPFEGTINIAGKSRAEYFITGSFAKAGEKIPVDGQMHGTSGAEKFKEKIWEKTELLMAERD